MSCISGAKPTRVANVAKPDVIDHAPRMRVWVAVAPVIVGLVLALALLFMGVIDARQPNGCINAPACPSQGFQIGYAVAAATLLVISVAIGVAAGRSYKPGPR